MSKQEDLKTPAMRRTYDDFKIPTICKRCYYRRDMATTCFVKGNAWGSSCCAYHLIEGEFRNCETTDTHCGKFRKRERIKK